MSDPLQKLIKQAEAQKLQIELQIRFKKNLALFEERFPAVHRLISNYAPANISLHIDPNGHLNLIDKKKREYIYNIEPEKYCHDQVRIFKTETKVRKFRTAKSEEYNDRHIHIKYLNRLLDRYSESPVKRVKSTPNLLTNLLLSGVGIGYHIPLLLESFDIHNIMIYEKCTDSFHASLHTLNWEPILDYFKAEHRSITFCVGVSPDKALAQMEHFINFRGLHSQMFTFIFQHTLRQVEMEFIDLYTKELRTYLTGLGYYDDEQIGLAHAYHNVKSKNAVFLSDKTYKRKSRLLLIGNGPSLDYHKEYIERNRHKAIIMTCGTALGSLLRMGVKPDFHVEMERTISMNDFLSYGTTEASRSGITLFCLHTVSPTTISAFDEACYAVKTNDAGSPIVHDYFSPNKLHELPFCNPTVANCGLSFAVYMGFSDIHMIGIDLGIPTEGKHHSKYSLHYEMEEHVDEEQFNYDYEDENNIYREGNFGGTVKTHKVLDASRLSFERLLELVHKAFPNFRCINTNQGIKIKHTLTEELESLSECQDFNKENEIHEIKKNHLLFRDNKLFNQKTPNKILTHFYKTIPQIKIPKDIENDFDLVIKMNRIYGMISKNQDAITHYLLRGSINTFFGAIIENCLYCKKQEDFLKNLSIGREVFNEFVERIEEQMQDEPFRLDDTVNPILTDMKHKTPQTDV